MINKELAQKLESKLTEQKAIVLKHITTCYINQYDADYDKNIRDLRIALLEQRCIERKLNE